MSHYYVPASRVFPSPLEWLWPWRLAFGKIALLEGDPELGKIWITCDLCARLSVGQLFPDGQPSPGPANSILLNAEDGSADTLRPRLEALGADLNRVIIPSAKEGKALLSLPSDIRKFENLIADHEARLVVLDPWIAFLDNAVQAASDAETRKLLRALTCVAQRRTCVILLIRHLRKLGAGRAMYRGVGSIGLVAACRSAWLIARSPLDDVCVFAQLKNNLAPRQPSLAYEFRGQESGVGSQESENTSAIENQESKIGNAPAFRWLGPTFWSAEELTGGRLTRAGRRAQARVFMQEFLQKGPEPVGKVRAAAKDQGIAERTLSRAAKELKIQTRRVIFPGRFARNYWLLPGQKMPLTIPDEYVAPQW